jgi:hypothetical protein
MKSRWFLVLTALAVVAILVCGQLALAEDAPRPHYRIQFVPRGAEGIISSDNPLAVTKNLYGLTAAFTATDYPTTNSDGTDIWPCFGGGTNVNPDCPSIGNPTIDFPVGGVALGTPAYVWSLANCNATSTSSPVCGETETFYEDDSGDTTDQLTYTIIATQGTTEIYNSGTVVFGPNPFGGLSPAADVIIYGPANFGDQGQTGGANNGDCFADFNYPLTAPTFPGATYVVAANKTCGAAVSGLVTITAITELATPTYTKQTTKAACTPVVNGKPGTTVGPPCYTVTFAKKFSATQKWQIFLQ